MGKSESRRGIAGSCCSMVLGGDLGNVYALLESPVRFFLIR